MYDGLHHNRFEVWTQKADDTRELLCRDHVTRELWIALDVPSGHRALRAWMAFQMSTPVPNGAPSGLSSSAMKADSVAALLVAGDDDATTNSLYGSP